MNKKFVVIGSSAAGTGAVMALSRLAPDAEIVWLSQDAQMPYNKCLLADFVQHRKTKEQITLLPTEFFAQNRNITFRADTRVTQINRAEKKIITASGDEIVYDQLLLTLGVEPVEMPAEIKNSAGVFQAHELRDFEKIDAYISSAQVTRALVIGAGLTGLEVASALHMRGVAVTIIEKNNCLLQNMLNSEASQFLAVQLASYAQVGCGLSVQRYSCKEGPDGRKITGVYLSDSSFVQTNMLVCAFGARPRVDLAHNAGLAVDRGIVADDFLRTTDPHIFASGDCAQVIGQPNFDQLPDADVVGTLSSTWAEALIQGSCAAHNMLGMAKNYNRGSFLKSVSSHFFNQKLLAYGTLTGNSRNVYIGHASVGFVFVYNEKINGCVLVGNYSEALSVQLKKLVRESAPESMLSSYV